MGVAVAAAIVAVGSRVGNGARVEVCTGLAVATPIVVGVDSWTVTLIVTTGTRGPTVNVGDEIDVAPDAMAGKPVGAGVR